MGHDDERASPQLPRGGTGVCMGVCDELGLNAGVRVRRPCAWAVGARRAERWIQVMHHLQRHVDDEDSVDEAADNEEGFSGA
jgi:hypothetical protein